MSYTFSSGLTVSIGDRIIFNIASNIPDYIEGIVSITEGGMPIVVTDNGTIYELQKIIDPSII